MGGYGRATDEQVLAKARAARNGANFCRLYDRGDVTGHRSQSEADFTLCLLLLYWTNGDTTQADRLFRRSALMSEKWDRRAGHDGGGQAVTYGERTMQQALDRGNPTPQLVRAGTGQRDRG